VGQVNRAPRVPGLQGSHGLGQLLRRQRQEVGLLLVRTSGFVQEAGGQPHGGFGQRHHQLRPILTHPVVHVPPAMPVAVPLLRQDGGGGGSEGVAPPELVAGDIPEHGELPEQAVRVLVGIHVGAHRLLQVVDPAHGGGQGAGPSRLLHGLSYQPAGLTGTDRRTDPVAVAQRLHGSPEAGAGLLGEVLRVAVGGGSVAHAHGGIGAHLGHGQGRLGGQFVVQEGQRDGRLLVQRDLVVQGRHGSLVGACRRGQCRGGEEGGRPPCGFHRLISGLGV
jgi:hypothetical protein